MTFAHDGVPDDIEIQRVLADLDPPHGAQDRTNQIIVQNIAFKRGPHQAAVHTGAFMNH